MNNLKGLLERIDTEISMREETKKRLQQERVDAYEKRTTRYREAFLPALNQLEKIWVPRLQLLAEKIQTLAKGYGESVKVTPEIRPSHDEPHSGEMIFVCQSPLAKVQVKFGFFHDINVRNLLIEYHLEIIPVFLKFEPYSRLEQNIDSFHEDIAAKWLDDRIVDFVRTYLAIHENSTYVADQMVEDPIAHMRFPKYAANTTFQRDGITYYFISPETKRAFQNGCAHDRSRNVQGPHYEVGVS